MIQDELSDILFIIDVIFELQAGRVAVMEEMTKHTMTRREVIVTR